MEAKVLHIKEVTPEPVNLDGMGQYVEVEVEINEVLYPLKWQAPKTVKYMFGGGFFSVQSIRVDTVGKQGIYIMSANGYAELKDAENVFFPSYDWNLIDGIGAKTEVVGLLQKRVEKEQEAAKPK